MTDKERIQILETQVTGLITVVSALIDHFKHDILGPNFKADLRERMPTQESKTE